MSLSLLAVLIGLPIGLGGALLRRDGSPLFRRITGAYVEFMRNTPLIVLLYLVFFGLPHTGLRVGGYTSALVALTLNCSAYMIEIFRGGLAAIPRGQYEAAISQGFRGPLMFRSRSRRPLSLHLPRRRHLFSPEAVPESAAFIRNRRRSSQKR